MGMYSIWYSASYSAGLNCFSRVSLQQSLRQVEAVSRPGGGGRVCLPGSSFALNKKKLRDNMGGGGDLGGFSMAAGAYSAGPPDKVSGGYCVPFQLSTLSLLSHTHTHRPKEVYQWIQNEYQPPLVMLLDPDTSQPTANIPRMDEILHASWDQVMRKYADTPEPDVHAFAQKYDKFLIKGVQMQSTPITGSRLAKRLRKMGVHTATGLDG